MMKLDIRDIQVYYLNIDSRKKQRDHIEDNLKKHNFKNFKRVLGVKYPNVSASLSLGYARAIYNHILSHDKFEPFILLEDDSKVKDNNESVFEITYPEDTDCIYIGMSGAADPNTFYDGGGLILKRSKEFPRLFRIYNTLSGHAILILTLKYALAYMMTLIETASVSEIYNRCADIYAVRLFPLFNVYALETPIFYQAKEVGGNEIATDINLKNEKDTILTDDDLKRLYKARIYTQLIFDKV